MAAAMAAASAPVEPVAVPDAIVHFAFDSSELTAEGTSTLDCTMEMVVADGGEVSFAVEGHTDASGPNSYNERLGLARAEAVKAYLVRQHRVPADEIAVVSYGEGRPASSNDTRDGRASNRRVVVKVGG
jgi:outer membrane protein OmpA-like peptidoglycan-associated protein